MERQGAKSDGVRHRLEMDMRFGNQLAQTSVVTTLARFASAKDVLDVIGQFVRDYQLRFGEGSAQPQAGVVVTAVRVVTFVDDRKVDFSALATAIVTRIDQPAPKGTRRCWFRAESEGIDTGVFDFESLEPGHLVTGPAVIVSKVTTILVEPGWHFLMGFEGAGWLRRNDA
jgi:N-methylhydantoinase A